MTEYKCGSAKSCKYGDMCKPNFNIGACSHYKAEEPMTNEEWRKTCSAEDFAYWLADVCAWAMEEFRCGNTEKANIAYWEMWLKQPHKEE